MSMLEETIKEVILLGVSEIPAAGPVLELFTKVVWQIHEPQVDYWAEVKDSVTQYVDKTLLEQQLTTAKNKIESYRGQFNEFIKEFAAAQKGGGSRKPAYDALARLEDGIEPIVGDFFAKLNNPAIGGQTIPVAVALGTLHLTTLRWRVEILKMFRDEPRTDDEITVVKNTGQFENISTNHHETVQNYASKVRAAVTAAVNHRMSFITMNTPQQSTTTGWDGVSKFIKTTYSFTDHFSGVTESEYTSFLHSEGRAYGQDVVVHVFNMADSHAKKNAQQLIEQRFNAHRSNVNAKLTQFFQTNSLNIVDLWEKSVA